MNFSDSPFVECFRSAYSHYVSAYFSKQSFQTFFSKKIVSQVMNAPGSGTRFFSSTPVFTDKLLFLTS